MKFSYPFNYLTKGPADASKTGSNFDYLQDYLNNQIGSISPGNPGHLAYYSNLGLDIQSFPFGGPNAYLATNNNTNALVWKTLPFFNVLDYGAIPGGVFDNATAFANAYAALIAAGGGTLYIPTGTWKTSGTLSPQSNSMITGTTQRATVINYTGTNYFLSNQTTGTVQNRFSLQSMTVNVTNGGSFCQLGTMGTPFSELNQHVDYWFKDLLVIASSIVPGTYGFRFNTMIRTWIENCIFENFDIEWEFEKFDEAICIHNRLQVAGTYGMYLHNTTGDIVADESTFIHLDVTGTPSLHACVYLQEVQNIRFLNTYLDASGGTIAVGWKFDTVQNATVDGATLNTESIIFDLNNCRNLNIRNVGLQNPDQSPAPQANVNFNWGGLDLTGAGSPFASYNYGLIHVDHCAYPVANAFKNKPGVTVTSTGKLAGGESHFGGMISDVSNLYATQILDRNGSLGLLKETGTIISPFSANLYMNGSNISLNQILPDALATTGYTIFIPKAGGNIYMDIPYPNDILPGSYEIVARVKTGAGVTGNFFAVYFDGVQKENFSGINTTTSYQVINGRFNFNPVNNPTTLSIRLGDQSQDLYIDYIILRPCANSLSLQTYSPNDLTAIGNTTTPGYRIAYASALPSTGTWATGDLVLNTSPTTGGIFGWSCVSGGTSGTWKPLGPTGFSLSANNAVITASDGTLASSSTTATELSYVHGVTSAIQTQLNGKQATLTIGNFTDVGTDGITVSNGTSVVIGTGTSISQHVADSTHNGYLSSTDWGTFNGKQNAITLSNHNRVLVSDGSGNVVESSVTSTTLGYLDATSSIQTQLNGKQATLTENALTASGALSLSAAVTVIGSGAVLTIADASASVSGIVNTVTQSFAGAKTFTTPIAQSTLPLFGVYNSGGTSNNTGDGTVYTVAWDGSAFDNNSNFSTPSFTAPTTGKYLFTVTVLLTGIISTHTAAILTLHTTSQDYIFERVNPYAVGYGGFVLLKGSVIAAMTATNVANVTVQVSNGTKVVGVYGSNNYNWFTGHRIN